MEPLLATLSTQLGEIAVRNTAGAIVDKIGAVRAKRQDQETIAVLDEIVNGLLTDKTELIRIAQAFEDQLVAQRISESEVRYISENLVPIISQLAESAAENQGKDAESVREFIELLEPVLSVETVTVFQLIGFNFRRAIGEPLTQLMAHLIASRTPASPDLRHEIEKLHATRENAYVEVAKDAEAFDRLEKMRNWVGGN